MIQVAVTAWPLTVYMSQHATKLPHAEIKWACAVAKLHFLASIESTTSIRENFHECGNGLNARINAGQNLILILLIKTFTTDSW